MRFTNDKELLAEFNREAVPHRANLFNFALKLTGDSDDAEDLVQETYLRAFRFFDKFQEGTNCKAWLFRILKNLFINRYKQIQNSPEKIDYEDVEYFYENAKPSSANDSYLTRELFENLLNDDITAAINELSVEFRTVIILSDIEDMTYEEIAEFIDCPIGTVRSRLHRARKMLYAKLHPYAKAKGLAAV
jgi:RNA polymerase sigma-70 factor (ECF subfamily)